MGRSFEKEIAPIVKRLRDIEYEFKNTANKGMVRLELVPRLLTI